MELTLQEIGQINFLRCKKTINKFIFCTIATISILLYPFVYAYETVEAVTEIPNSQNTEKINKPLKKYNPYYDSDKEFTVQNKKELRIPNPLDEITLRKIKESSKTSSNSDVKKQEDITIDSDELEYFDETGELEARGNVVIVSNNGTVVTANRAVYDKYANTVKLYDNVILNQGSNKIAGDYMLVDLNEENAIMDAPVASTGPLIRLKAAEGYAYTDKIEAVNGSVELAKQIEMQLQSSGFNNYNGMLIQDKDISFDYKNKRFSAYKIKAKEIVVEPGKDHDSLILKNADIYYKKMKIVTVGSLEIFADKDMNNLEVNIPIDLGSLNDFGTYVGLGYIFKMPTGASLKVSPLLSLDHGDLGVGGLGELKSKRLDLKAAWASNNENLIIDGEYKVSDRFKAEFGRHAYKDEWFLGSNRAGHLAQLVYNDQYFIEDLNAMFEQRITAGYASDYHKEHQEDNNFGTSRFRWQAQLSKPLFSVSNDEQDMTLNFGAYGQTAATLYGTGQTFGLVRGGPYIGTRVKNWKSSIGYALGGVHGNSPFNFDKYNYGKSSIDINESLKLCKYLSLGYRGTISPLKDNDDDDLLTENRFYAVMGPEDIKLAFSYDTIRENFYIDFMFMLGTDSTGITYDKLTVKEFGKLQKKEQKFGKDLEYRKIKVPENL